MKFNRNPVLMCLIFVCMCIYACFRQFIIFHRVPFSKTVFLQNATLFGLHLLDQLYLKNIALMCDCLMSDLNSTDEFEEHVVCTFYVDTDEF